MGMKFLTLFFLVSTLFLTQCKNDFEVNEDWKDYTIVYGILNQYDSVNYVRVTKSFLGNEDAYIMAQQSDSLYYNGINVILQEWKGTNLNKTITMYLDSSIARDSGIFASNKNFYYKTSERLDSSALYKLIINVNGKMVTSETNLLERFLITINFNPTSGIAMHTDGSKLKITLTAKPNERIFEPSIRFWYYELSATDTTKKYLDISLSNLISPSITGGTKLVAELKGDQFYTILSNNIKDNPAVIKRIVAQYCFDIMASAGSDEMYTYMQINAPATGIITEKPVFTNISNGIGLFTARVSNKTTGIRMHTTSVDSLADGRFSKNLKFLGQSETVPLWAANLFH